MQLKVGDTVFVESKIGYPNNAVMTIIKIGRRYIHIGNNGKTTIKLNVGDAKNLEFGVWGSEYTHVVYSSIEAYEQYRARDEAWALFVDKVSRTRLSPNISIEKIKSARVLLFGE